MVSKPTQIYITSWLRSDFLKKTIGYLVERTTPGTFSINVYDNGSDKNTRDILNEYIDSKIINSVVLDSRNTGCRYNKIIFHAMVESSDEYYCVTDNDVYPPKLSPDWLSCMIDIMNKHPEIGMLAPQLPPQGLQMPIRISHDVVYAGAVGNTLKLIRRESIDRVIKRMDQALGAYGDDGLVSKMMREDGWEVAFCKNIFCYHAGQCTNWGYTPEQIALDPRKAGYGRPFTYEIVNQDTYEPEPRYKM
jgi:glycosyltransferase involved in cell wall biosynthesis